MGVVNVTPDSFSDGGLFVEPSAAVEQARRLAAEGATLVDVGGESTRPGAAPVSADEELARVVPVLEGLRGLSLSIDTSKAAVARRALELGAELVNDVTALRGDAEMAEVVAEGDAFVCLMHMQGEPRTMQAAPEYDDVVSDVLAFLEERVAFAVDHGIREERICIDPGIGFGKTADHNLELLRRLDELTALGRPLVVGVSRKSTLAKIVGRASSDPAIAPASVGAAVSAFDRGAWMIRAHDVRETVAALAVASAVERGKIAT
jgi:dihydropteroate synthase